MSRLSAALSEAECGGTELPVAIAAIRLLVFTGCRMSEVLTLRWEHVDLGHRACGCRKQDRRQGGASEPSRDCRSVGLACEPSGWVLPGAKEGGHLVNLQKPWRRLRRSAGLQDVRLHDLRHSFASVAAGLGEGLHMIGKLLGHTQAQITHRYHTSPPIRSVPL